MAKINRVTHTIFGSAGTTDNFAKFGSLVAGTPLTTKDLATIQALPAWTAGFQSEVYTSNKAPLLEDLNSCMLEHSTQVAYIFEMGIPEWDSATEYETDSVVQVAGQWFVSLQDGNTGHAPPASASNAYWEWINPPMVQDASLTAGSIPKVSAAAAAGVSPAKLAPSAISEDGSNVILAKQIKFPDATTQATAASPIQNQNVVTGTRAAGVPYRNTTGKVMFVSVGAVGGGANSTPSIAAFTDGNSPPTTQVAAYYYSVGGGANERAAFTVFFIVLPGNYYQINLVSMSLATWVEWN